MTLPLSPRRWLFTGLALTSLLTACGGGIEEESEHQHEDIRIDTAGRLAVSEQGTSTLRLHDLDSGTVEASHVMQASPSAVYASPGGRYAVVVQATPGRIQFVDGGIWQEDHGDHLHDYKQASRAKSYVLTGTRPSHYDVQAGLQAAVYFDGDGAATPPVNAGVSLLNDASIGSGGTLATLNLSAPLHGLAEPVGDKLLTVARATDASDTLPTHLTLHQRSGSAFSFVRQVPTRCNSMHGSFSSGSSTLVGCAGGMLLVKHTSSTSVNDGQLLPTSLRVATIAGHARLPDHFIGVATEGTAPSPVTTRFYAVNAEAGTVSDFTPQGWATGNVRRAHGFDRSGQRLFIVDNQGTLIVAQHQGGAWANLSRVTAAIPLMPTAAPWPAIVANGAKDEVYITDPVAKQLVVVNSVTGAVVTRRDLGYVPSALAWLGITR